MDESLGKDGVRIFTFRYKCPLEDADCRKETFGNQGDK